MYVDIISNVYAHRNLEVWLCLLTLCLGCLEKRLLGLAIEMHGSLYFGQQERVDEHVDLASSQRHRKEPTDVCIIVYCSTMSILA